MVNWVITREITYVVFVSGVLSDTKITDVTYESNLGRSRSDLVATRGTPQVLNESSTPPKPMETPLVRVEFTHPPPPSVLMKLAFVAGKLLRQGMILSSLWVCTSENFSGLLRSPRCQNSQLTNTLVPGVHRGAAAERPLSLRWGMRPGSNYWKGYPHAVFGRRSG